MKVESARGYANIRGFQAKRPRTALSRRRFIEFNASAELRIAPITSFDREDARRKARAVADAERWIANMKKYARPSDGDARRRPRQ